MGVQANNLKGNSLVPGRLCGGYLDKASHVVPAALFVRLQSFRKSLHMTVEGQCSRHIVYSMIYMSIFMLTDEMLPCWYI